MGTKVHVRYSRHNIGTVRKPNFILAHTTTNTFTYSIKFWVLYTDKVAAKSNLCKNKPNYCSITGKKLEGANFGFATEGGVAKPPFKAHHLLSHRYFQHDQALFMHSTVVAGSTTVYIKK